MTQNACVIIPRCAGSSAARRLWGQRHRRAKWAASRRVGSRRKRTFRQSPIFRANGSIPSMVVVRREVSCSIWISSVSPTHGEQENSVWNGHYACTCYHPLFLFNQFGDLERCALRPGNVHSADGWDEVLKPVVARYRGKVSLIYFRADAGFANPEVYEFLEAERIKYMPYVCRQTASCRNGSDICSNAPLAVRRMMCAGPMRASPIRLEAGRDRAG